MTDLEMTRLCADACGCWVTEHPGEDPADWGILHPRCKPFLQFAKYPNDVYDPLHDDAQAFALVKQFRMELYRSHDKWTVLLIDGGLLAARAAGTDLNRAIVECVAKMQSESTTTEGLGNG